MSDAVLIAFIAAVPGTVAAVAATIVSIMNHEKIKGLSVQVNGRLTELLALTAAASRAEGKLDKA